MPTSIGALRMDLFFRNLHIPRFLVSSFFKTSTLYVFWPFLFSETSSIAIKNVMRNCTVSLI